MAVVNITFSGDDARLRAQHDRLLSDQEKVISKYRSLAGMSNKSSTELRREIQVRKSMAAAERVARKEQAASAKLTQSLLTPRERYNALLRDAIQLQQRGGIDRGTLKRRFKQLKAGLAVEEAAIQKARQAGEVSRQASVSMARETAAIRAKTNASKRSAATIRHVAAAERQAAASRAEVNRITQASETPQERFNRRIADITAMRTREGVTTDLLTRKYQEAKAELKRAEQGTDEYKRSLKEKTDAERRAATVIRSTLTAGERYKQQLREIKTLHRQGKLNIDQMRRAREKLRSEFRQGLNTTGTTAGLTSKVTRLATAYGSVRAAVSGFSAMLQDNIELQEQSLELADRLGHSQSGLFKNMAAAPLIDKAWAASVAKDISRDGVPVEFIVDALGAVASAGAEYSKEWQAGAVRASASINIQDPASTRPYAAAIADIRTATGNVDQKENLGFLLESGKQARPDVASKVAVNLPKAVQAGVNALPASLLSDAAARKQAAREAAAAWAVTTKSGTDITGEAAATATIQRTDRLNTVFRSLPAEKATIDNRIQRLEADDLVTTDEQLKIDSAKLDQKFTRDDLAKLTRVSRKSPDQQRRFLQLQIRTREDDLRLKDAQESSVLSATETQELAELRVAKKGLAGVSDPGFESDRIHIAQNNPAIYSMVFKKEFGEARFKSGNKQLMTKGSPMAKLYEESQKNIQFNSSTADSLAKELQSGTPELTVSDNRAKLRADRAEYTNEINTQFTGLVREHLDAYLLKTREGSYNPFKLAEDTVTGIRISSSYTPLSAMRLAKRAATNREQQRLVALPPMHGDSGGPAQDRYLQLMNRLDQLMTAYEKAQGVGSEAAGKMNAAAGNLNDAAGNLNASRKNGGAANAAGQVGGDK